jgi:hypothetical protein
MQLQVIYTLSLAALAAASPIVNVRVQMTSPANSETFEGALATSRAGYHADAACLAIWFNGETSCPEGWVGYPSLFYLLDLSPLRYYNILGMREVK